MRRVWTKREHNKEEVQRYRRWELDQEQSMRSRDITGVAGVTGVDLVLHRNMLEDLSDLGDILSLPRGDEVLGIASISLRKLWRMFS